MGAGCLADVIQNGMETQNGGRFTMEEFQELFKPCTIRGLTVKNRIVMLPMGSNFALANGEISEEHIQYYLARAKGGAGLLTLENVCIAYPLGANGTTQLRLDADCYIPRLYKLCECVHQYGAKISVQLNHVGSGANAWRCQEQPVSASDVPFKLDTGRKPRPLSLDEINEIIAQFGDAAYRAKLAGFDAVEVHAGHSYLLHQFLSPLTNHRTDLFGGTAENRSRIVKLILEEIRTRVGEAMPIFLRVSADEMYPGGNTVQDTIRLLQQCAAQADVINVSCSIAKRSHYHIDIAGLQDSWRVHMAQAVKEGLGKPVIASGNIRDPYTAEKILKEGSADFIGIGRGLIADPQWAEKAKNGEAAFIRKCISCNIGCMNNRAALARPIRCSVNPAILESEEYKRFPVSKPCKVLVIGAGVAGLEAACTAAEIGCTVLCVEKTEKIGGWVEKISHIPDKFRMQDLLQYFKMRISQLPNLTIQLNSFADDALLKAFMPQYIVQATGSKPVHLGIKGLREYVNQEKTAVCDIQGFLDRIDTYPQDASGKEVVIIGGGAVGLDVVTYFCQRNANVTLVEMNSAWGNGVDPITKSYMEELMEQHEVKVHLETKLLEVGADYFIVEQNGAAVRMEFAHGFLCLGLMACVASQEMMAAIARKQIPLAQIGDCQKARKIIDAIAEGRNCILRMREALEL